MAFQEVPDTASFRVLMVQTNTLVQMVNTIYVRNTVLGWTNTHLATTGAVIGDAWRDEVMPELQNTVTLDAVECEDQGEEFGNQQRVEYNTAGSVAGTPLTLAAAIFTKLNGDGGSAPRRGGLYISGFGEADLTIDTWDSTRTANIQAALQAISSALAAQANGDAWVIVSRFSKSAVPTPPHKRTVAVTNTIASFDTKEFLATQRDRRTGIGS